MPAVYLIPSILQEEGIDAIPAYIPEAIKNCSVFFVENERTTRRFFKQLWKSFLPGQDIVIDQYEWFTISAGPEVTAAFSQKLKEGKNIGIVSEAGCPGVADPGQLLISIAQEMEADLKPLVGPNSILLALMASGMNGQQFHFNGYLPIDNQQRINAIREIELRSAKQNCTEIFIETPYRNNQLLQALLKHCRPGTRVCVAVDLTGKNEWVKTKTVKEWQRQQPDIHKRLAIFLIYAQS